MSNKVETIYDPVKELIKNVDIKTTNQILANTELKDFEMNKSTIQNISEWALNGASDQEIRKKLSLNKNQWAVLVTCCPTLLLVMKESRAIADIVVAGSLFQAAVGGRIIKKQQAVKVGDYEDGTKTGEHIEIIEIQEELPPNPLLLKFLAENKLSEKFSGSNNIGDNEYKKMIDSLSPKERALLDAAKKAEILNGDK